MGHGGIKDVSKATALLKPRTVMANWNNRPFGEIRCLFYGGHMDQGDCLVESVYTFIPRITVSILLKFSSFLLYNDGVIYILRWFPGESGSR